MEMEKCKVSIQFLLTFRQSGDVLFFLYARRLRGCTATDGIFVTVVNRKQQNKKIKELKKTMTFLAVVLNFYKQNYGIKISEVEQTF